MLNSFFRRNKDKITLHQAQLKMPDGLTTDDKILQSFVFLYRAANLYDCGTLKASKNYDLFHREKYLSDEVRIYITDSYACFRAGGDIYHGRLQFIKDRIYVEPRFDHFDYVFELVNHCYWLLQLSWGYDLGFIAKEDYQMTAQDIIGIILRNITSWEMFFATLLRGVKRVGDVENRAQTNTTFYDTKVLLEKFMPVLTENWKKIPFPGQPGCESSFKGYTDADIRAAIYRRFSTPEQEYLLTMGAFLAAVDVDTFDWPLRTIETTEKVKNVKELTMAESWGIHSASDLKETLQRKIEGDGTVPYLLGLVQYAREEYCDVICTLRWCDRQPDSFFMDEDNELLLYKLNQVRASIRVILRYEKNRCFSNQITANEKLFDKHYISENILGIENLFELEHFVKEVRKITIDTGWNNETTVFHKFRAGIIRGSIPYKRTLANIKTSENGGTITLEKVYRAESIYAWDLDRGAMLARRGANIDWLTYDECFDYIRTEIAPRVVKEYQDWEEYIIGFMVGRFLWFGNPLIETVTAFSKAAEKLFGTSADKEVDGFGFWKQYPLSEIKNRLHI